MIQSASIISTAYLPPIRYFEILLNYDLIYIEKHETYYKQTYRNRCEIYCANGLLPISIPVVKPNGNRTSISEVKIDNSVKWRNEHWRAIQSSYQNSAYFEFLIDYLEPFYQKKWDYLWDYNIELLYAILNILDLKIEIRETEQFVKEYPAEIIDNRNTLNPKQRDLESLHSNNNYTSYFQVFGIKSGFIPNLSIIDLLCNYGMESITFIKSEKPK
jgi:hypothetical protein